MTFPLRKHTPLLTAARMPCWALASVAPQWLSLVLLLLLLSLLSPSSHAQTPSGYFHVIGPMGDGWAPRQNGNAEYVGRTTVFYDGNQERPVTLSNFLLVYGGSANAVLNDVWASSDGRLWVWAAGSSNGYTHSRYPTTFPASMDVCHCQDANYTQYRAGGYRGNVMNNEVWRSTNGYQWSVICGAAQWQPRYLGNMAGDAAGNVFLAGGILALGVQPRQTASDVWRSTDRGYSWAMMRAENLLTGPGKRAVAVLLAPAANTLAWMSGVNPSVVPDPYLSDVWVSSDGGASFGLSTGSGAFPSTFPGRDDANGELTANGLFVIAAGYNPRPVAEVFNDVWVSGNGGFTWSLCVEDAEWSDRRYLMTVVDGQGFFYVMGGANLAGLRYNDVWKSSFTFNNLTAVSAMCRATYEFAPLVPSCGAGLKCFPQDSSTYLQFAVFPSCPACPLPINLIA